MNGFVSLAVLLMALGYSQARLVGGWEEVSVDDAKVREIAGWAAGAMGNNYELLEITKAEKQVSLISCRKNQNFWLLIIIITIFTSSAK